MQGGAAFLEVSPLFFILKNSDKGICLRLFFPTVNSERDFLLIFLKITSLLKYPLCKLIILLNARTKLYLLLTSALQAPIVLRYLTGFYSIGIEYEPGIQRINSG